jgi:hypothetical protein
LLDFAANAGYLPFDGKHLADLAGPLQEDSLETLFGFA